MCELECIPLCLGVKFDTIRYYQKKGMASDIDTPRYLSGCVNICRGVSISVGVCQYLSGCVYV